MRRYNTRSQNGLMIDVVNRSWWCCSCSRSGSCSSSRWQNRVIDHKVFDINRNTRPCIQVRYRWVTTRYGTTVRDPVSYFITVRILSFRTSWKFCVKNDVNNRISLDNWFWADFWKGTILTVPWWSRLIESSDRWFNIFQTSGLRRRSRLALGWFLGVFHRFWES